ncbi:MAG: hypothetical protein HYX47_08020 [Burkholderiales bacterium]|nr:hypothetical protein [Burkholderiales bacterium]
MSFLDQLKSQANSLQSRQGEQQQGLLASTQQTEMACNMVSQYLKDLVRQLNVIEPDGPALALDSKVPWPPMKLTAFQADSRKKTLRDREVFDYIAIGWRILPRAGAPVTGSVSANFLPDLQRLEARLAAGWVQHERHEQRHPEKNTLQLVRFDYTTESRGNVRVTPDHDKGMLAVRLANLSGLEIQNTMLPVSQVQTATLDELAKLIVGQPSRFI